MGVGSNFGGNTFSLAEIDVGRRADSEITTPSTASNTVFLQTSRKPKDKKTVSEENKQFDPGGKGGEPPPWKVGVLIFFSFLGELWAGTPVFVPGIILCAFVFACLSVVYHSHQGIIFLRAGENMGREKKINEERNRRASTFLPINPLNINTTIPGSICRNALGIK